MITIFGENVQYVQNIMVTTLALLKRNVASDANGQVNSNKAFGSRKKRHNRGILLQHNQVYASI